MACIPNINTVLSLDFSAVNDAANWSTDSLNPVQTIGGQLVLNPSSILSKFTRPIGTVDPLNNRIRIRANFELVGEAIGPGTAEVTFELLEGVTVLETSCAEFTGVTDNLYNYFLDRTYDFLTMPSGSLTLRITFPTGFQYKAAFDDLLVEDFFLCQDNIRTYFILDGLLNESLTAVSAAVQLLSWEVGGVETLTPAFFAENNIVGTNPLANWLFAQALVDGSARISDDMTPNSFNPFFNDWGMDFANVAGNYFGGKTLGPISGSDYGPAILGLGIDIPEILTVNDDGVTLTSQPGAFFIDIDYEQDLKIEFAVLVNQASTNVFNGPSVYRTYTATFNKDLCTTSFTYVDELTGLTVDATGDGFLSGLTGPKVLQEVVPCDEAFSPTGNVGNFTFRLELGPAIGESGINYNAYGVPDRFVVNYDGTDYDSGYVGLDTYDAQLLAAGVAPFDINTTPPPGNGEGTLTFPKPNASPSFAIVTVEAPLGGTAWQVTGICPAPVIPNTPPTVTFNLVVAGNQGNLSQFSIAASDAEGPIANYTIDWDDGSPLLVATGPPPTSITHVYNAVGSFTPVITVFDGGSPQLSGNDTAPISVVNPNPTTVLFNNSVTCNSCLGFKIVVPTGSSYTLDVTSDFEGGATWATGFCDPGGASVGIAADIVAQVLTPGTYEYHTGIDAAIASVNDFNSNIFIRVKDGANTITSINFDRTHSNNIC